MSLEDKCCLNCEAVKRTIVSVHLEDEGINMCLCRQKLSDHYRHYLEENHVCAYHSDYLDSDPRFKQWRETIE